MKVIYPNAMACGCPPELFWKLNPRKLEPFYEWHRLEVKQEMEMAEWKSWRTGYYDMLAMGAVFGKHRKYPHKPEIHEKKTQEEEAAGFRKYAENFRRQRGLEP